MNKINTPIAIGLSNFEKKKIGGHEVKMGHKLLIDIKTSVNDIT